VLPFLGNLFPHWARETFALLAQQLHRWTSSLKLAGSAGISAQYGSARGTLLGRSRNPLLLTYRQITGIKGIRTVTWNVCTNVYGVWAPSFPDSFPFQL